MREKWSKSNGQNDVEVIAHVGGVHPAVQHRHDVLVLHRSVAVDRLGPALLQVCQHPELAVCPLRLDLHLPRPVDLLDRHHLVGHRVTAR